MKTFKKIVITAAVVSTVAGCIGGGIAMASESNYQAQSATELALTVSAVDAQSVSASSLGDSARAAITAMKMNAPANAVGAKVGNVGLASIYLYKRDSDTLCIVRDDPSVGSAGACGPRTEMLKNGGVYLITGQPGNLSAVVVVPDGINSLTSSNRVTKIVNNVAIFALTGETSTATIAGTGTTYSLNFGPLIPPSK